MSLLSVSTPVSEERQAPRLGLVPPTPPSHHRRIPLAALATDVVAILVASVLAYVVRMALPGLQLDTGAQPLQWIAAGIGLVWLAWIGLVDGYQREVFGAGTDEYRRVAHATALAAGSIGLTAYLVKYDLARGFFILVFVLGAAFLLVGRWLVRRALHSLRLRGQLRRRVVIAGSGRQIDEIVALLQRQPWLGYDVVGALSPPTEFDSATPGGIQIWGNSDDAKYVVDELSADTVFVCAGAFRSSTQLRQAIWDLEQVQDLEVLVAPNVTDVSRDRVRIRPVGGLPVIHVDPPRHAQATRSAKRIFDLVCATAILLALSPLFLFAAWRVKAADGGPVFFQHKRIGKDGQEFGCLKFRTMVPNAEDLVAQLQKERGVTALLFKMKDDPRVTKPGKWMRRYSVDELPQLLNVLKGDMSLVGPRPQVAKEVELYTGGMHRRLKVRPGLTGLWQVSGRSNLSLDEAVRLDLYYVDNWSMFQDLSILARTFRAVIGSSGAY